MSTVLGDSDRSGNSPNRILNRVTSTYIHSDSIIDPNPTSGADEQSSTWVDSLVKLDRAFSGGILRLCYDIIDMVLLCLGLYYGTEMCSFSNALVIVSILILVFSGLGLFFTVIFLIRNWSLHGIRSLDVRSANRYKQGYVVRALFRFLRFVCVCVGTGYAFTSKIPINKDCEIVRFYLGVVCFTTWLLMFCKPPKPSLPVRLSLFWECFIVLCALIFNSIHFISVMFAVIRSNELECMYTRIEDLYFGSPLKLYGYVGLVILICLVAISIFASIINQLFYRLPNWRKVFTHFSCISNMMQYCIVLCCIYYYSVGAVLLFGHRLGGSCRVVAPNLYRTLWVWELIQGVLPIIICPLVFGICCLGFTFGSCLSLCFPASVAVPIFETLQRRIPNVPDRTNADPPASPGTIDAIPMVGFGQLSDEFDQTECGICRGDYEPNEQIKKLPCGHLFHATCVSTWLSRTRICPICRRRITSTR